MSFRTGDRVRVRNIGIGTVIKVDGIKALVKLDSGVQLLQPFDKIESYNNGNGNGAVVAPPTVAPVAAQSRAVAERFRSLLDDKQDEPIKQATVRKSGTKQNPLGLNDIESLRYGVVPFGNIERLTIGFDRMEAWTQSRLPEKLGRPSVSEVCGAFGTGKSHSMSLVRHIASKRGYLTARVEIDSQEVTLANPEGLLKALWPSLSGTDFHTSHPIIELCLRAIQHNEGPPVVNAEIERTAENYKTVRTLANRDTLDEIIDEFDGLMSSSGQYPASEIIGAIRRGKLSGVAEFLVHPPIGRTTVRKPYDFLENLIAYSMLAEKAGYRGLVITIDEFEITKQADKEKIRRCAQLLAKFTEYFQGELEYPSAPLSVFFATVADADSLGDKLIEAIIGDDATAQFSLKQLNRMEILDLARKIFDLYAESYGIDEAFDAALTGQIVDHVESASASALSIIREFIKTWIFTLDSKYGPRST